MNKYVDIEPLVQYAAEQAYCSFCYPTEIPPKELTEREVWEFVLKYLDFVSKEPVSDTAEVKDGKWIDTGSGQECSVCGEIQYGYDNRRNYCANCGARMHK